MTELFRKTTRFGVEFMTNKRVQLRRKHQPLWSGFWFTSTCTRHFKASTERCNVLKSWLRVDLGDMCLTPKLLGVSSLTQQNHGNRDPWKGTKNDVHVPDLLTTFFVPKIDPKIVSNQPMGQTYFHGQTKKRSCRDHWLTPPMGKTLCGWFTVTCT